MPGLHIRSHLRSKFKLPPKAQALILAPWHHHKRSGHPSQRDTYFKNQLLLDEGLPYTLDTLAKVLEPKEEEPCK